MRPHPHLNLVPPIDRGAWLLAKSDDATAALGTLDPVDAIAALAIAIATLCYVRGVPPLVAQDLLNHTLDTFRRATTGASP